MTSTTYRYRTLAAHIVADLTEYYHKYGPLDSLDIISIVDTFNGLMTQEGVERIISDLEEEYPEEDRDEDIKEILDNTANLLNYDSKFHVYEDYKVDDIYGNPHRVRIWTSLRDENDKLLGYGIIWGCKQYEAELIRSTQRCEYLTFSEEIGGTGYTYVISSRDLDVE